MNTRSVGSHRNKQHCARHKSHKNRDHHTRCIHSRFSPDRGTLLQVPYLMRRGKLFEIYDLQNDLNDKVLSDPFGKGDRVGPRKTECGKDGFFTPMLSC